MGKFKSGKAAGKDEVMGEMIKGGGVIGWRTRFRDCNMAFESGVEVEDWRFTVIVPMYKGKGERTKCSNYRGAGLLNITGKNYAGILVDRVHKVTGGV